MNLDKIVLGHITQGMIIAFVLGMLTLLTYAWKKRNEYKSKEGYSRYMVINLPNSLFHVIASFLVLFVLDEISEVLIENYIPVLKTSQFYRLTLAGLTGMFGSVLIAIIFEKVNAIRNKK